MSCPALLKKKKKKRKGRAEGWTLFIAFSSCLVLAHCFLSCSSPSPCRLTSIPPFPLLSSPSPSPSPPLFSKPSSSLSGCMNTAEFHLNPRTWELWAKARGAADTPLPHPEQLLNLRNRIISAKGRSHCSTVRNAVNKPQKKTKKRVEEGRGEPKTGGRKLFVSLMLTSVIAQIDLVMNSSVGALIPTRPPLNPMSLIYFSRHAQRAVTISG